MNYFILHALNTLAIIIELMFDMSKFIIIHSIVCAILLVEAIKSIDWDVVNEHRNTIGSWFIYESPVIATNN
tara:strand:- start:180 stop:395 length:216 start_codon:yes stop_codon:yes gene_type:complete